MPSGTSLGDLLVSIGIDPSGLAAGAGTIESSLESLGTRLFFLGSRIGAAFGVPLAGAIAAIEHYGAAFDQAMTESLAIMDHVTPEIRARMEEQARAISETTKFSSTEAAKAYYDLASAGLNAQDAIAALPTVAKFAQAGMMDLAKAGEWLAGSQAALGLKTQNTAQNLFEMTRISDVLTQVNNKSIGTVKDYAQALTNNGAVAMRTYGLSVEQGVAILGVFGQQHILGNRAGTLLNTTLRDLTAAAVKHAEVFRAAGIAVFDANGNMRNMADIADDLTKKLGPMSTEGRRAELMALGLTARSMQGTLALIGMGDQLRSLEHDLHNAGGATEEVAQKQMLSFNNEMARIGHQFENVAIQIFTSFVPAFKDYVVPLIDKVLHLAQDLANYFDGLSESTKGLILAASGLAIALGPVLVAMGGIVLVGRVVATVAGLAASMAAIGQTAGVAAPALAAAAEGTTAVGAATAVTAGIATATVAIWAGVVIAVGAVVYALKEMVGGWERLFDVMNVMTGGVLYIVVDAFKQLFDTVSGGTWIFGDMYELVHAKLYQAFDSFKSLVNDLATDGDTMRKKWDAIRSNFYGVSDAIGALSSAFSTLNNWMRDHVPLLASVEDWTKNKLAAAVNYVKDGYHNLIQEAKDYNATLDVQLPKINKNTEAFDRMVTGMNAIRTYVLKNQPAALPAMTIGGMTVDQYLDSTFGKVGAGVGLEGVDKSSAQIAKEMRAAKKEADALAKTLDLNVKFMAAFEKSGVQAAEAIGKSFKGMGDLLKGFVTMVSQTPIAPDHILSGQGQLAPDMATMWDAARMRKFNGPTVAEQTAGAQKMAQALSGVSREFSDFAKIVGDNAIGNGLKEIGVGLDIMARATKASADAKGGYAGDFGYGSVMFDTDATGGQRAAAAVAALGAVVAGVSNIAKATSASASGIMNAFGGAAAGAEAGAAFGPWGMAVGAAAGFIVGIIRGKPEWAKAADEIANDFGVKISDSLAKTIADSAKDFGGSSQASAISHLSSIIKEAGGLSETNLGIMTARLHDVFSMIETHQMTIAQGTKTLDDNWAAFAKTGTDAYGFLDKSLVDIIKLNGQFGTDSKAIFDYLKAQVGDAVTGFNLLVTGGLGPMNKAFDDFDKAVKADDKNVDTLNTTLQKTLVGGQAEFDRLGRLAQLSFGAALASGSTFLEAISAIGPGLDTMSTAATNFGFTQTAAFTQLLGIRTFTQANKDLVGELDGVNKMIVGLANSGFLTQMSFNDLGLEANSVFTRMKAGGLDSNTALLLMKPTLQTLWEAQQKFGFKVDDTTQSLIDMGVESGIIGEGSKTDSQKMVDGIDSLNKTLKDLVAALTNNVGGAFDALAVKARGVTDGIANGINNIPRNISFQVDYRVNGGDDTPQMAEGGILTGPRRVIAGEAGTEAIIPLAKLHDYLQPSMSGGGQGGGQDIVVQIDGREVARASLAYIPEELRRNGIFT